MDLGDFTSDPNSGSEVANSGSDVVVSHLAEPEMAFSDLDQHGAMLSSTDSPRAANDSPLATLPEVRLELPELAVDVTVTVPAERAQFPAESPDSPASSSQGEARLMYQENEGDNSCVDMDEEESCMVSEPAVVTSESLEDSEMDEYHTARRNYSDKGGTV